MLLLSFGSSITESLGWGHTSYSRRMCMHMYWKFQNIMTKFMRIVVAACKWETSDGSMHINSVNFVCKCKFSKFCCFWVLGPLLQKVLVEGTPPIVGECVCICIESFKILWQNLWYSTLKKRYTFFLNFPHNHLQCLAMVLFKGWKIPKNNGMNGLIGYLESMVQFEPKRR